MSQSRISECDCDRDQCNLCEECPNRLDIERFILYIADDRLSDERAIARLALHCRLSTDIAFLAEQFSRIITALKVIWREREIPELEKRWLARHPIVQYMTHMMRNRTYPEKQWSYPRVQLMVENLAEVEA